jgi:predicted  nucleic acid-binding Zn-ribbon protein
MRPLADILADLERKSFSADQALELFGMRGGPALTALLSQGSGALRELTGELENAGGTAERIATAQMKGLRGALYNLKSAAEAVSLAIADSGFLEFATNLTDRVTGLLRRLADLNPETLRTATVIGGLVAAVGPLLIAVGSLVKLSGLAIVGVKGLAVALGVLSGPVGIIAGVVVAGVSLGMWLKGRRDSLDAKMQDATTRTREFSATLASAQDKESLRSAVRTMAQEIEGPGRVAFVNYANEAIATGDTLAEVSRNIGREWAKIVNAAEISRLKARRSGLQAQVDAFEARLAVRRTHRDAALEEVRALQAELDAAVATGTTELVNMLEARIALAMSGISMHVSDATLAYESGTARIIADLEAVDAQIADLSGEHPIDVGVNVTVTHTPHDGGPAEDGLPDLVDDLAGPDGVVDVPVEVHFLEGSLGRLNEELQTAQQRLMEATTAAAGAIALDTVRALEATIVALEERIERLLLEMQPLKDVPQPTVTAKVAPARRLLAPTVDTRVAPARPLGVPGVDVDIDYAEWGRVAARRARLQRYAQTARYGDGLAMTERAIMDPRWGPSDIPTPDIGVSDVAGSRRAHYDSIRRDHWMDRFREGERAAEATIVPVPKPVLPTGGPQLESGIPMPSVTVTIDEIERYRALAEAQAEAAEAAVLLTDRKVDLGTVTENAVLPALETERDALERVMSVTSEADPAWGRYADRLVTVRARIDELTPATVSAEQATLDAANANVEYHRALAALNDEGADLSGALSDQERALLDMQGTVDEGSSAWNEYAHAIAAVRDEMESLKEPMSAVMTTIVETLTSQVVPTLTRFGEVFGMIAAGAYDSGRAVAFAMAEMAVGVVQSVANAVAALMAQAVAQQIVYGISLPFTTAQFVAAGAAVIGIGALAAWLRARGARVDTPPMGGGGAGGDWGADDGEPGTDHRTREQIAYDKQVERERAAREAARARPERYDSFQEWVDAGWHAQMQKRLSPMDLLQMEMTYWQAQWQNARTDAEFAEANIELERVREEVQRLRDLGLEDTDLGLPDPLAREPQPVSFGGTPHATQLAVATPLLEASNVMLDAAQMMRDTFASLAPHGEFGGLRVLPPFTSAIERMTPVLERLLSDGVSINVAATTSTAVVSPTAHLRNL